MRRSEKWGPSRRALFHSTMLRAGELREALPPAQPLRRLQTSFMASRLLDGTRLLGPSVRVVGSFLKVVRKVKLAFSRQGDRFPTRFCPCGLWASLRHHDFFGSSSSWSVLSSQTQFPLGRHVRNFAAICIYLTIGESVSSFFSVKRAWCESWAAQLWRTSWRCSHGFRVRSLDTSQSCW